MTTTEAIVPETSTTEATVIETSTDKSIETIPTERTETTTKSTTQIDESTEGLTSTINGDETTSTESEKDGTTTTKDTTTSQPTTSKLPSTSQTTTTEPTITTTTPDTTKTTVQATTTQPSAQANNCYCPHGMADDDPEHCSPENKKGTKRCKVKACYPEYEFNHEEKTCDECKKGCSWYPPYQSNKDLASCFHSGYLNKLKPKIEDNYGPLLLSIFFFLVGHIIFKEARKKHKELNEIQARRNDTRNHYNYIANKKRN